MKIIVSSSSHTFPSANGVVYGANRAVLETARFLQEEGHSVHLIEVSRNPSRQFNSLFVQSVEDLDEQAELIRSIDCDVLISVSDALLFTRARGRKNVVYHHNPTHVEGIGNYGRELYASIQGIVVVSEAARQQQIAWGAPANKIHVVPNGMDPAIFYPRAVDRRSHQLVFAGNIVDYKGLDVVLAAFRICSQQCPQLELIVCGGGKLYAGMLEAIAGTQWMEAHGLLSSNGSVDWTEVERQFPGVKYLGALSSDEMARVFSESTALVSGSRIPETFGLISLEAQACGCIPILPNFGGFPETVEAGITGLLYAPCDAEALADTVLNFILRRNSNVSQVSRGRAIQRTAERFTWSNSGEKFIEVLAKLAPRNFFNAVHATLWRSARLIKQCCVRTMRPPRHR